MANTIESKLDNDILTSLIDGTIEEIEDDMITTLGNRALSHIYDKDGVRHLRKIYFPNVTTVGEHVINATIGANTSIYQVTDLDASIFPKLQNGSSNCFNSLGVKRVNLPEWTGGTSTSQTIASRFREMKSLETVVLGKPIIISHYEFYNGTKLKAVCLGYNSDYTGNKYILNNAFLINQPFDTLVLYGEKLWVLNNINAFNDRTCFASNGTGGTIYVPQSMIESYTNATNWSDIIAYTNNKILPIEGSEYEHYYCDGTPVPTN